MKTISEVREQFPQYSDLSDTQLVGALHQKFYSDMPIAEFSAKVGLKQPVVRSEPSDTSVALNASSKAIAGIPDALLNTPNRLLNLGKAAFGASATAFGRSDLAPNLTPDPNYVTNALTKLGAIRPEAEPVTSGQRIIDTMTQAAVGTAINPSSSVRQLVSNVGTGALGGAAAGVTAEETGSEAAALLAGSMAPSAVQATGRAGRARMEEARLRSSRNQLRDESLRAGQAEGYVIPPTAVNPSGANKVLESIAGKAAIKQQASLDNQKLTIDVAARELGFPPGTALTPGKIESYRNSVSAPYREVAAISPMAEASLFQLREARQKATQYFTFYDRSADPNALAAAENFSKRAEMLEKALEKMASKAGKPGLIDNLREARTQIAKSHDIERALNVGSADVNARNIGAALDKGKLLTGGLKTIGKFSEAFPQFTQEGAAVPTPGVSKLGAFGGGMLGVGGYAAAGPVGITASALPFLSGPTRSLLLSGPYQRAFAQPNYNQGRLMNQIPEQNVTLQSLLLARAIADAKQGTQ